MRKFTLVILMALMALVAAADNVLVTPPADLATKPYRLNGMMQINGWENISRPVQIGFDGNDVYLQGFSYYLPEAWIKGTLSDDRSTVSFPMQYIGQLYNSKGELRDVYFWPATQGADGWTPIDAVFNYNEALGTFVLQQDVVTYIFENTKTNGLSYFVAYDSYLTITDDSDTVEAPDGLQTEDYQLDAVMMDMDDDDQWYDYETVTRTVKVGFGDDDCIYLQGLCPYIADAWVKGERQGDQYVLRAGQFFGTYVFNGKGYPIYLVGYDAPTDAPVDIVLTIDEATGQITTSQWVALSALADDVLAYELLSAMVLSHIADVAATPADPEISYFEYDADYEMGLVELNVPAVDVYGKPLLTSKLSYQFFTDYGDGIEPYVFEADLHEGLTEDMTVVPYDFEDNIDFLRGGGMVIFYAIQPGLKRIGVKSIYEGGGERHESVVSWWECDDITDGIVATAPTIGQSRYVDLLGRQASPSAKGLLLRQTVAADGTVSTTKVVRR